MESPSKLLDIGIESPTKSTGFELGNFDLPQEEFFGAEFLVEDVDAGWDIMAGFKKIGSGNENREKTPKMRSSERPGLGLGRSFSSRF